MRLLAKTVCLGLICTAIGCNENGPPPGATAQAPAVQKQSAGAVFAGGSGTATSTDVDVHPSAEAPSVRRQPSRSTAASPSALTSVPPSVVSAAPVPPAGAQWTIYCESIHGPAHVEEAQRIKDQLIAASGMRDWYLVHHAQESVIYYGFYAKMEDPGARRDKGKIDSIAGMEAGQRRFRFSQFVPAASPDPDSPSEWNLENAPAKMFWSLQVGAFRGVPDRKKLAVEAVRQARQMGVEAYYFHGDSISSVCVGAWPKRAVVQQGDETVARSPDPNTPLMVVAESLPANVREAYKNGERVRLVAPKLEIEDPTLLAAIKKYPTNAVNGYVYTRKASNGTEVETESFLVQIPGRESLLREVDTTDPRDNWLKGKGGATPDVSPTNPESTAISPDVPRPTGHKPAQPAEDEDPLLGKLKTLGEH